MSKIIPLVLVLVIATRVNSEPHKHTGIFKAYRTLLINFSVMVDIEVANADDVTHNTHFLSVKTESISKITSRKKLKASHKDKIIASVPSNRDNVAIQMALNAEKKKKSGSGKPRATVLYEFDYNRTVTKTKSINKNCIYEFKIMEMSTLKVVTIYWIATKLQAFTKKSQEGGVYYLTGPTKDYIDHHLSQYDAADDTWTCPSSELISISLADSTQSSSQAVLYKFTKYIKHAAGFGILSLVKKRD